MIKYIVSFEEANQTLEKYVKRKLEAAPLSFIYKIFRKKDVKVNGKREGLKYKVVEGDEVLIYINEQQYNDFKKSGPVAKDNDVKHWIVYEDDNILVINKPKGLLVQKDKPNGVALDAMVINYYLFKHPELNEDDFLPAPCHRIDRNTSGLVIFGKTIEVIQKLMQVFKDHDEIEKNYYALVKGQTKRYQTIKLPLVKDMESGFVKVSFDDPKRKDAISEYNLIENYGNVSLINVKIITGRTHQIRVHMSYVGYPLVGDNKYGDFNLNKTMEKKYGIKEQYLHAHEIKFRIKEGKFKYLNDIKLVADLNDNDKKILKRLREEKLCKEELMNG